VNYFTQLLDDKSKRLSHDFRMTAAGYQLVARPSGRAIAPSLGCVIDVVYPMELPAGDMPKPQGHAMVERVVQYSKQLLLRAQAALAGCTKPPNWLGGAGDHMRI
jgi:hypothetical protein